MIKKIIATILLAISAVGATKFYGKLEKNKPKTKEKLEETIDHNNLDSSNAENVVNDADGISRNLNILRRIENIKEEDVGDFMGKFKDRSDKFFEEDIYELPGMAEKKESIDKIGKQLGEDKRDKKKEKVIVVETSKWLFKHFKELYFTTKKFFKGRIYNYYDKKDQDSEEKPNQENQDNGDILKNIEDKAGKKIINKVNDLLSDEKAEENEEKKDQN